MGVASVKISTLMECNAFFNNTCAEKTKVSFISVDIRILQIVLNLYTVCVQTM